MRGWLQGVDDETLHKEVGHKLSLQDRAATINKLLQTSRIELFSSGDGLVYKMVNLEQAVKCGLSNLTLLDHFLCHLDSVD